MTQCAIKKKLTSSDTNLNNNLIFIYTLYISLKCSITIRNLQIYP